nr:S-adenosylmethionine mitochondrial carrier protein isoform X2 [Loxodonta africana]
MAGGVAGVTVDLVLFPLDTIKTRLQSPQGFNKAGGFRGIYAGVPSAAIGSFPNAAAFFITYEYVKWLLHTDSSPYLMPVKHMLAASAGEVIACLIRVPSEVVKQRAQVSASSSTVQIFTDILYQEGIQGLYRGYKSTVLRECNTCGACASNSMSSKRNHATESSNPKKKVWKAQDMDVKMKIMKACDNEKKVGKLADEEGLSHLTVWTIIKGKNRIWEAVKGAIGIKSTILTKRQGPIHEMEKLLIWIEDQIQKRIPVSLLKMQAKARSLFANLKEQQGEDYGENFNASKG